MAKCFKYGMIGCGEIAADTSGKILASDLVEVVHCMDINESLASDLAQRHNARSTTKMEDVLADGEVAAVIISTPHFLHASQTVAAAAAGKHVLVEKPIACNLTQADEMIVAADNGEVKLGVLYPVRFEFPYDKACEIISAGAIGKINAIELNCVGDKASSYWTSGYSGRAKTDWRSIVQKSGGGVTIMNMSHNLDAMVRILDLKPIRIFAEHDNLRTPEVEVEDFMSFVVRLEGGAILSCQASSASPGNESFGDRIYGEKGQVVIDAGKVRVFLDEACGDIPAGQWTELAMPEGFRDGRTRHVEDFARAVTDDGDAPVSGVEARRALEIVRGAYISGELHQPVAFPITE